MQPSRMFNHDEMYAADLMREAAAMRTIQVDGDREPSGRGKVAAIGSLAWRLTFWRKLSARGLFPYQVVMVRSQGSVAIPASD